MSYIMDDIGEYMRKKRNYINNKDMLIEIHKSKNSFCEFDDPIYERYDYINEDENLEEVLGESKPKRDRITDEVIEEAKKNRAAKITQNLYEKALDDPENEGLKIRPSQFKVDPSTISKHDLVFRIYTYDHIPISNRKKNPRRKADHYVKLNFIPYKHYIINENDELVEVGRSHSKNNEFCQDHGSITQKLATMFILLVERYSQKSNWRGYTYNDEMKGNALLQLSHMGLRFNEARSQNPFAYFTKAITRSFTKVLNDEKKNQGIRDDILIQQGQSPSHTKQVEFEEELRKIREDASNSDNI